MARLKKKSSEYTAKVKILGREFAASGDSAFQAVANLEPSGVKKGVSLLTVSKGDVKKEKVLTSPQTFRLFSASRIMREIALKSVSALFNGI